MPHTIFTCLSCEHSSVSPEGIDAHLAAAHDTSVTDLTRAPLSDTPEIHDGVVTLAACWFDADGRPMLFSETQASRG